MKEKLDYKKMVEDIEEMVNTDFGMEMESKTLAGSRLYTQSEAKKMAKLIAEIYGIAHRLYCSGCRGKYLK